MSLFLKYSPVIFIFVLLIFPMSSAKACRDCPFPTPLASLHWLMPSGHSEVMVEEVYIGKSVMQSTVRLVDAVTGEMLAIGTLDHPKGRKRIIVILRDKQGGKIEAQIYYMNSKRDKVKIKIECDKCNVDQFYLY